MLLNISVMNISLIAPRCSGRLLSGRFWTAAARRRFYCVGLTQPLPRPRPDRVALSSTTGSCPYFKVARREPLRPIHHNPSPIAARTPANFQYGGSSPISRNTKIYPIATSAVGPSAIQNARFTPAPRIALSSRGHPRRCPNDLNRKNLAQRQPLGTTAGTPRSPCPSPKPPPRPTALPAAFPSVSPSSARKNTSPYFPPKDSRS